MFHQLCDWTTVGIVILAGCGILIATVGGCKAKIVGCTILVGCLALLPFYASVSSVCDYVLGQ